MQLSKDSPFHPIAPDRVLIESPNCLAFLDAYPISKGHTLVIPLQPIPSIYDLDDTIQADLWDTVKRTRDILNRRHSPDGFNIGINDGPAAGQTVPHAHIHIIPRYRGDVPDPRGGIRWIIPDKARYWDTDTPVTDREVIGIDVGVRKGMHVVALSLSCPGSFTVLGNGVPLDEAVALCRRRKPACIAIDSPPGWALEGSARQGEKDLRRLGIQLYATPSDPQKQKSKFYDWMRVGFKLFAALSPDYPLYRQGPIAGHALEVFPHATATILACPPKRGARRLAGQHRPAPVSKVIWRRRILRHHHYDISPLTNADSVDAALAAITAAHALRGQFTAFGNPTEGVIITPRATGNSPANELPEACKS